jgi:putative transposase
VEKICRQLGISQATFFKSMGVAELKQLRQLEEDNHQLKKLVADLSLDKQMLKYVIRKVKNLHSKSQWHFCNYGKLQIRFRVQASARNCRKCIRIDAVITAPTYSTTIPGLPSSSTPIATPSAQHCCNSATLSAATATNNPPLVCGSTSQGKASLRPRVISFS